ncbi:hypothetical protein A8C32_02205 [Flavivirga aquatica]|uniref:Glucuronyl hydrolase n=1 Tax=Flavivirga aquatica TaxID=1849968 RepID=A0A1E5TA80_9FLAO|nr:glycoside hydrolase family 88 protein [Flavivirga aquatica]OEK08290.1 hypothetical protein A8C32_02205 [Flavivirga aquatica]
MYRKKALLIILYCFSHTIESQVLLKFDPDEVLLFAESQYEKAINQLKIENGMPRNGHSDGSWNQKPIEDWTSGFFPGTLWYLYENSKNEKWLKAAQKWTAPLEPLKLFNKHHDIGFMVYCSYGNGYRLTQNKNYKEIILQTSNTLATRYRPTTKTILSWGDINEKNPKTHKVIIDNMMNLEMLEWASKNGGSKKFDKISRNHANTTLKNHFRKDFSSYHLVEYNPNTGKVQNKSTVQGFADDSMWSRGQAWGIYGFIMMYRETAIKKYLKTSENLAKTYFESLPIDNIAYWDFNAPNIPNEPRDASSAAIVASACLELFELTEKKMYYNQAISILNELASDKYLAKTDNYSCVLLHSVGYKPINSEVNVNINYADYYFIEALIRLKKLQIKMFKNKQ